ncbi:MAG: glycosyltransferase family 39 protein [Promethearchaeota archaeon]
MNYGKLKEKKVLFLVILTVSIFLRIINITSEQIWADEAISIHIAKLSINDFWKAIIRDIHPPLYYVILKGWIFIFGDSILSFRMLSVVFSILALPILFLIGKEIKNESLGFIIIFFYSISPFAIYYANEIRSYTLIHLLFTISIYFSIRILKDPENIRNYIMIGIVGTLLIYTHYMGVVYMMSLYVSIYIFNRKKKFILKYLILSSIIMIGFYIPWIPFALNDLLGGAPGYAGGLLNLVNLSYYAFNYFLAPVPSDINNPYVLNLILLTFLINLPLIIISLISISGILFFYKNEKIKETKLIFYFLLTSFTFLFGISITLGFFLENSFTAKNLIGGLSLTIPLQSVGLYYLIFNSNSIWFNKFQKLNKILNPKFLKKIFYQLFIALIITHLIIYPFLRAYYLQKPDWEGCVKKLEEKVKKNDIIITAYPGGRAPYPMEYYSELYGFDLDKYFYELNYNDDDIEEFFDEISDENITRIWIISFWERTRDPSGETEDLLIDEYDLEEENDYSFRLDIELTLYKVK